MDNKTVNTIYVASQPPYKIIKYGNKIGVQIGTQRVIIAGGNPFRTETHDSPVVAAENRIAALKDNDYILDGNCDGEVWDNIETKNVSVLCDAGVCLEWQQFIKILWHDHARLGDSRLPINKVFLFEKLVSYNKSMMLPSPDLYTLHLLTETSAEGIPYVVRTERDDVFAVNVEWTDSEDDLEKRLLADLRDYLLILSPNRSTNLWHMHYETEEERLRLLVERLNANPKATSFRKQMMASITIKALPPYEEKDTLIKPQDTQMEESVIGKISPSNIRYYYEGWRNGKHGSICQTNGIYRFVEMKRGKSGMLDDVNRNEEDNPIVAIGIVAYWLQFNSRMDTVIKRMTKYNCEIPKDIREQFDIYTQIRFEQFRKEHRDDPNTLDWDWEKEFYANVIIPHEMAFNKRTEALFDYISDSDIILVRSVMNSYIKYLKKIRIEKGYQVNLDQWEEENCINGIPKTEAFVTSHHSSKENIAEIPKKPQTNKAFGQEDIIEKKEWDNSMDYIFNKKVNPLALFNAMKGIKYPEKITERRFYYVAYRVFDAINYFSRGTSEHQYLQWINLHFNDNGQRWIDDHDHIYLFRFKLDGSAKELRVHPSKWNSIKMYSDLAIFHFDLANTLKNTFTFVVDENGNELKNSVSYEHLKDYAQFLSGSTWLVDRYFALDDDYINKG